MKKHRPLFTRREMLKVGAIGGLTLSQYLRAQAASGKKVRDVQPFSFSSRAALPIRIPLI